MNVIHTWLTSATTFFLKHDVFIRFMIVLCFLVGSVSAPPSHEKVVTPAYENSFRILSARILAVIPDMVVVVINHPNSRRSQLAICLVVMLTALSVLYVASCPTGFRNAADRQAGWQEQQRRGWP